MTAPAIGIDFGTSNCCVGVWDNDHVEIIVCVSILFFTIQLPCSFPHFHLPICASAQFYQPNEEGDKFTPSCVAFTYAQRLFGNAALNQIARNPTNTVFSITRLLGARYV
jgi:heat shock protein 1/8